MKKEKFISKYREIHDNIASLEKEISTFDRQKAIENPELLEDLKRRVTEQLALLEKTRQDELSTFS
jgi:ribosome-interacting GTPase 1